MINVWNFLQEIVTLQESNSVLLCLMWMQLPWKMKKMIHFDNRQKYMSLLKETITQTSADNSKFNSNIERNHTNYLSHQQLSGIAYVQNLEN